MSVSRLHRSSRKSSDTPADLARFERLYAMLLPWIIARARRLSEGDRDLRDDLLQTALCALWDLCRTNAPPFDVVDIKAHLYGEMLRYRRAERRAGVIAAPWVSRRYCSTRPLSYVTRGPSCDMGNSRNATANSPDIACGAGDGPQRPSDATLRRRTAPGHAP